MKRTRRIIFSVAATLIAIILISIISSLVISLLNPPPPSDTPDMYRPSDIEGLPFEHAPGAKGIIAGATASINALGFRGGEIKEEKEPGSIRIAVIGDSVVYGQGVQDHETLPAQLEALLNREAVGFSWEVVNAGVRGYNSRHYLLVLEHKLLALGPDLIVLVITEINDPERERFVPHSDKLDRWQNSIWVKIPIVKHFYSMAYINETSLLVVRHVRQIYDPAGEAWPQFCQDLARIRDLCQNRGIPIIAVSLPLLVDEDPFQAQRKQLQEKLDELGVMWIDPRPQLIMHDASDLVVSRRDFHPNARALGITARMLAGPIITKLEPIEDESPDAGGSD